MNTVFLPILEHTLMSGHLPFGWARGLIFCGFWKIHRRRAHCGQELQQPFKATDFNLGIRLVIIEGTSQHERADFPGSFLETIPEYENHALSESKALNLTVYIELFPELVQNVMMEPKIEYSGVPFMKVTVSPIIFHRE